jgi:glycerol-3-phosphate dehydrogenase
MAESLDGDDLIRAANQTRSESRRLVALSRAARTRSTTARAALTGSGGARAMASPDDPLARRERLLGVKAHEIAHIEKAIQRYVTMAKRWRDQSNTVMADKLDTKAINERERLALAIAERDAWPPVLEPFLDP